METQKKKDEWLEYEVLRVVGVRKEKGAKEHSIIKAVQACYFIDAKKEVDACDDVNREGKAFFREMRRVPMWKSLLKLWNDGYTPSEAAKTLKINYSTAYYYFKKFKARQKPRNWNNDSWRLNPETQQLERRKEPYKEYKARLEAKKLAIRAAEEKRARKGAKMRAIFEKQQTQHA